MEISLFYCQSNQLDRQWMLGTKSIIDGLKINLDKEIAWCNDHLIELSKCEVIDENDRFYQDLCIPEKFALGWVFNIHTRYDHVTVEECMELYHRIYNNLNLQG